MLYSIVRLKHHGMTMAAGISAAVEREVGEQGMMGSTEDVIQLSAGTVFN